MNEKQKDVLEYARGLKLQRDKLFDLMSEIAVWCSAGRPGAAEVAEMICRAFPDDFPAEGLH